MGDLISREKAFEVLTEYYHQRTEIQHIALREALDRVPDADTDLSEFCDKLWKNAYMRGHSDGAGELSCEGCKYYRLLGSEYPCNMCRRICRDHYEVQKGDSK